LWIYQLSIPVVLGHPDHNIGPHHDDRQVPLAADVQRRVLGLDRRMDPLPDRLPDVRRRDGASS
jgi:hypothetical protein